MIELVNETIQSKEISTKQKLKYLEQLLTIKTLSSIQTSELITIYDRILHYFEYGLPYFSHTEEELLMADRFFLDVFCDLQIIEKIMKNRTISSPNEFYNLLNLLGLGECYACKPLKQGVKTSAIFAFLEYCFTHLPEHEKEALYFVNYLTEEEQISWLRWRNSLITTGIKDHKKTILKVFENLSSHVLEAIYDPKWESLLSSANSDTFFRILKNNSGLLEQPNILQNIETRKNKASHYELQKHFPFYFFKQSFEDILTIYQIICNSTFISSLSETEKQIVSLFKQLIEGNQPLEVLRELEKIGDYQSILYDICYHIRFLSAKSLVTNTFSIKGYPNQNEITISPNELKYFFIRTNDRPEPFISKGYPVKSASFSVISTRHPHTYLGNERTCFGFSNIDPNMIAHVYPHDSLSNSKNTFPYYHTDYTAKFVDINTLLKEAEEKESYPEIIVLKKHFEEETLYPDYILGINEFKEQDLMFSELLGIPKVKLLVKDTNLIHHEDYYNKIRH